MELQVDMQPQLGSKSQLYAYLMYVGSAYIEGCFGISDTEAEKGG